MKVGVSFLKNPYEFSKIISMIDLSNADFIHVDVADGLFVNNRTPFDKTKLDILKKSKKPKEVHLMTLHLEKFIDVFSYIEPECITYEFEATTHHNKIIKYIKEKNCQVGIAISILTELEKLEPFLKKIDQVLVMSIIPGYGGQKFVDSTIEKVQKLLELKEKYKANFIINIDGGINKESVEKLKEVSLDRIVAGSYICNSPNFNEKINTLKNKNIS